MKIKFIEACDGSNFNHGKFMLGRFIGEWMVESAVDLGRSLLFGRGWSADHLLVWDLETGEGAIFRPGGYAKADLDKHKIWVCPMFEPFLDWLYKQDLRDLDALPAFVNLGAVPIAMSGYRRPGGDKDRELHERLQRLIGAGDPARVQLLGDVFSAMEARGNVL